MTIEQKAKAYDEAYKVAEDIHRFSSNPAEIKRMEEIFPVLKESEDERIRKRIIHALYGDVLDIEETNKAIVWLEKQGRQKPADWSEEDESYMNTTIAYLMDAKEFKKTAENCIIWLKSLKDRVQPRNTWKPSDEQMVAISTAVNVLGKGTLNGKQLIELQEQLKKLKG